MSRYRARAALVSTLAAVAALAAIASTAPAAASAGPVGGPQLAGRGLVLNRGPGVPALPKHLPASAWLVADATTGQVLAAKDPHGRFLPASTLKMLTAITLIPRLNPHALVRPTEADEGVGGSMVGLVPHYPYRIGLVFTAMLVASGNDAAETLANAAGGVGHTLALMNAEARALQADDTVAKTPSGLDAPGETTSAYDLALIARAGLQMPAFRRYIATRVAYIPAPHHKRFQIASHNLLLTSYPGDIGVKNGYTERAEGCYVGAATRHGRTIIITLLHANPDFWPMARGLLNWGFAADGRVRPVGVLVPPLSALRHPRTVALPRPRSAATGHGAGDAVLLPLEVAGGAVVAGGAFLAVARRRVRRRRIARRYATLRYQRYGRR
jgi:D-alanyl-D-alanine carboxypeptidase (penicillin-binding protein 5/6)